MLEIRRENVLVKKCRQYLYSKGDFLLVRSLLQIIFVQRVVETVTLSSVNTAEKSGVSTGLIFKSSRH